MSSKKASREATWDVNDPAFLKATIKASNSSLTDVADFAGCSRQFIYQLAKGKRTSCSATVAKRIAGYFRIPTELLFTPRVSTNRRHHVREADAA